MTVASGYTGLSSRERSTIAIAIGFIIVVLLLVLLHVARGVVATMPAQAAVLKVFDVSPPPPRAKPVRLQPASKSIRARSHTPTAGQRGPSRLVPPSLTSLGSPVAIAPVSIESVLALPDQPIGLGPAAGTGLSGSNGTGTGAGSGNGDGETAGTGRGSLLTAAIWVRPPTRADFQREWPAKGYSLTIPVDVVLVCAVKKSGRPFHCVVRQESVLDKGFGDAAIRIAEGSLVRPTLRDGRWTDRRVIVPLSFLPAETHQTAAVASHP